MSQEGLEPADLPPDLAPVQGTGSPSILEGVRSVLAESPSSGSALAKRLGVRKARVLDVLHELEAAGEVTRGGENRDSRFRLTTPEERAGASAPEPQTGNKAASSPPDDPLTWVDELVRERWERMVTSNPSFRRMQELLRGEE